MPDGLQPSYSLVPSVRTPNVDPGDSVEIAVYLSGFGIIDRNKLDITHSQPYVLSSDDPGKTRTHIYLNQIADDWTIPQYGEKYARDMPLNREGAVTNAYPLFVSERQVAITYEEFNRIGNLQLEWGNDPRPIPSSLFPRILGELSFGAHEPPLLIELNTAGPPRLRDYVIPTEYNTAEPGDYSVILTLTYSREENTYQDQKRVEFHANSWVE